MPQLIAMIIIVVGAMIYMFQTFGGTGDKIEGIAQKTSVITEINNIKTGLKLAARAEQISATANVTITPETTTGGTTTPAVTTPARYLKALGLQKYFAEQINEQIEKRTANYKPLYRPSDSIEHKINTVAQEIYGANSVEFSAKSKTQLKMINELGFSHFSVCMAKSPASFSDNDKLIGRPTNFDITVREFEIASGAGFIVPLLGEVMRMPGLPAVPNAERIDIDNNGVITGLS